MNKDGAIDVWDCRTTVGVVGNHQDAPNENEFSPTQLGRQMHVSNGFVSDPQHRLTMYSGTSVDAFNADDNFQEALLVDPIGDPCGLWKWKPALDTTNQETSGLYVLQPENSVAYQTKPLIVSSTDAAGREIGSDVEFSFFETPNRGSLSAALTYDGSFLQRGIASVCAVP